MRLIILSAVAVLAMVSAASAQPQLPLKCLQLDPNEEQILKNILEAASNSTRFPPGGTQAAQLVTLISNKLAMSHPCPAPAPIPTPPVAPPASKQD